MAEPETTIFGRDMIPVSQNPATQEAGRSNPASARTGHGFPRDRPAYERRVDRSSAREKIAENRAATHERPDYWDGYHQAMLGHDVILEGGAEYLKGRADGLAAFEVILKKI